MEGKWRVTNSGTSMGIQTSARVKSGEGLDWTDYVPFCALLETRRSVRTGLFVACFWGCNVLALISWLGPYILQNMEPQGMGRHSLSQISELELFWSVVLLTLLVALPGRALFSMGMDIRSGAMELLLMTGTHPVRVLTGKWMAKMLEAVLMISTLMPYSVLHYFAHGTNPVYQVTCMCGVLISSAALCALAVGLSVIRNPVLRLIAAALSLFFAGLIGVPMLLAIGNLIELENWFPFLIMLAVFATAFIIMPLSAGASLLARYDRLPSPDEAQILAFTVTGLKNRGRGRRRA